MLGAMGAGAGAGGGGAGPSEGLEVGQAAVEAGEGIGEGVEEAIPLPLAELGNDEPEHCQGQEENEEVFHRRSADKYSMSFCKCQGKV